MTILITPQRTVPALLEPNYTGGMSFLQLVQRLHQESRTSGSLPATTEGQSGDAKKLVDWTATAWLDIQNERDDWFFMRQSVQFTTTSGQSSYTAAEAGLASFGNYKRDSFRAYPASVGAAAEMELEYVPWDAFRNTYLFGVQRTISRRPHDFTVDPAKNFVLGPIPDDAYVVNGEAYAMPTPFAHDADLSTMPPQFHLMIVWLALMYYAQSEGAPESYTFGQNQYERMKKALMRDQLPEVQLGGALA